MLTRQRSGREVAAFLARLPCAQREMVDTLRKLARESAPGATETVLWGSLSYHRPTLGGRVSGAVCLITPKTDGVHLGFIHGTAIPDPHRLLRGAGKAKRAVPIRSLQDIRAAELRPLIQAAADYDPRQAT